MEIKMDSGKEKFFEIARYLASDNYEKTRNESLNPSIYKKEPQSVCFYIEEDDSLIAGMTATMDFYSWLHIDLAWVKDTYRKQGLGSKLMQKMKDFALKNNCVGIRLTTWDFQAKGFYEKMGFKQFGELQNYPKGITRFFMCYYL